MTAGEIFYSYFEQLIKDYLFETDLIPPENITSINFLGKNHGLSVDTEWDYGRSYPIINGELYEPQYQVQIGVYGEGEYMAGQPKYTHINLSDLLGFMYKKMSS